MRRSAFGRVVLVALGTPWFVGCAGAPRPFENSVGMTMIPLRAGSFRMGSTEAERQRLREDVDPAFAKNVADWLDTETPQHEVRITRPFAMSAQPVTVDQFRQFVAAAGDWTDGERDGTGAWGYNPARRRHEGNRPEYTWRATGWPQSDRDPVVNVTWDDAMAFCRWLGGKEGRNYRLPTEAEWEYACRAGTTTTYSCGDDGADLQGRANVADRALQEKFDAQAYRDYGFMDWDDGAPFTSPVDRYPPNPWGFFDMHGNVCQWVMDWFDEEYYRHGPTDDPECAEGTMHVMRGGAWYLDARYCRAANRYPAVPGVRSIWVGFRVVCDTVGSDP